MENIRTKKDSGILKLMEHCALFRSLTEDQVKALMSEARLIERKEKEIFLQQGQTAKEFFLVISGELKLALTSRTGQEKVLHLLRPGDTFAEALMFLEKPKYPATATALSPCKVMAFPNELYRAIIAISPDACFGMLGEYSMRIRQLVSEIEFLTTHNATFRVIRYLLNEIPRSYLGATSVELRTPKHAIASRLSITPETLSRILAKLRRDGIIEISEKHVTLHDTDWMRKFVSDA